MANKCIHCGKEIEVGSLFCNHCGKKQAKIYYQRFLSRHHNGSVRIIYGVNQWFSDNPCVANVSCRINTKTGIGLLTNKFVIDSVEIKYELLNAPNIYKYEIEEVSNTTLFSGFGINSSDELIARWKESNPDKIVVYYTGGSHSRGTSVFFDIGNRKKVQSFVLYKKERQKHPL